MALSKTFSKRLEEFSFTSAKIITIDHELNNSSEIVLPFLISKLQHHEIFIFNFSESPSNLTYLSKRLGLNLSKSQNIKLFDGLTLLANMVESHYPLTKEIPFTSFNERMNSDGPKTSEQIINFIEKTIADLLKTSKQPILILNGIHFVLNRFKSDSNEYIGLFMTFLNKLLRLETEKTILCFDKSIKKNSVPVFSFIKSLSSLRIQLKDPKNGFTIDYSGNLIFRMFDGSTMKEVKKTLKIILKQGTVDFSEQIKVN